MPAQVSVRFATKRRYTNFQVPGVPAITLLHRAVVGIHVQGMPLLNFPDGTRTGENPRVDTRPVPRQAALRLHRFVEMHYVYGERDFNCFSFMRYLTGWDDDSFYHIPVKHAYRGRIAQPTRMTPYKAYVMSRDGVDMHGAVGFTSTVSFSVIGINQPLTMAPTTDLMEGYGTDLLIEVNGVDDASF